MVQVVSKLHTMFTQQYEGFVTHSEFRPYITTVGLYNDSDELMEIGKTTKPIKLSNDVTTTIVVGLIYNT